MGKLEEDELGDETSPPPDSQASGIVFFYDTCCYLMTLCVDELDLLEKKL